ncbi:ATP-binding protein [Streptomyces sp. NPDC057052]|uniref:ATP-binding protein n=1 Tax=Streptomyces sp. NPDC057052 TaxID=3346010 RepID=UPI00363215E1
MHSPSSQRHRPSPGATAATEPALSFTSTPRGVRLARLFVAHCLDSWGHPYDSHVNETLTLITDELCANAVRHGRVPGRDFHVRLTAEADDGRLRVEVSDTRAENRPAVTAAPAALDPDAESGRGLLLVTALADDWGCHRPPFGPRQDRVGGGGHRVGRSARCPTVTTMTKIVGSRRSSGDGRRSMMRKVTDNVMGSRLFDVPSRKTEVRSDGSVT